MSDTTQVLSLENSYAEHLPGFYARCQPEPAQNPELIFFNEALASALNLNLTPWLPDNLSQLFCGNQLPADATPIAQIYAGHQFGNFSPQLGDGRALLIGEIVDAQKTRWDIAFKGSGRTPFSRNGDGKAAIGPMLREAIISEAMAALGIPTTRALAVVATGEPVLREQPLPGAVLTRVAASHIRVGTFEYFAARNDIDSIRKLADYTIERHFPELKQSSTPFLDLLKAIADRQAKLIAQWMQVGFIHGVMNTDNMALSGETIDYGPCAFMEAYAPRTVFSSIDLQGRYAYGNQPHIARWNLARMAETLLPLLAENQQQAINLATEVIDAFPLQYQHYWLDGFRAKLGLSPQSTENESDLALAEDWLTLLHSNKVDFTNAWRSLGQAVTGNTDVLERLIDDTDALKQWLDRWYARSERDNTKSAQERAASMNLVNPRIIPRNHLVEEALKEASENGNLAYFNRLLAAVQQPYSSAESLAPYTTPAPAEVTACYQTFCGT